MRERLSLWGSFACVILLLPCVLTFLGNGSALFLTEDTLTVEKCLPALLRTQMPKEAGEELTKAQAVLVRTNVYKELEEEGNLMELLYQYWRQWDERGSFSFIDIGYGQCREGVKKTDGIRLTKEGKTVRVPYHAVSAGRTREGSQVLGEEAYSYLVAVESEGDKAAPDYTETVLIPLERLPKTLEVLTRDDSGYVLELKADERILSGEVFRMQMGLPSSCFSMEKIGEAMRFFCKGKGHGLGLSQYGGKMMEAAGSSYEEILQYYFPGLALDSRQNVF